MRQRALALALPLVATLALAPACGDDAAGSSLPAVASAAMLNYAAIVRASYEDSVTGAVALADAVTAFLADPSDTTLGLARQAWLDSREPYLQTEVYRFYDGPIDGPPDNLEALINAWPMDEVYIDYVVGAAEAGIIADSTVDITADGLAALNTAGGDTNIATGYHAIEFLLWGQDLSDDGPGARPYTDFVDGGTATHHERRREYLDTIAQLLVDDLSAISAAWAPAADNYRGEFEAAAPGEQLRRVLTGMITLAGDETGGERLQAALDSGSQEDEHSCFSDNTHRDMIQDIQGIENVWRGSYTRTGGAMVSGPGVRDVVLPKDAALAGQIDAKLAECVAGAAALVPPFDQEIKLSNTAGRARVQALVISLQELAGLFRSVFTLLDLKVPVDA